MMVQNLYYQESFLEQHNIQHTQNYKNSRMIHLQVTHFKFPPYLSLKISCKHMISRTFEWNKKQGLKFKRSNTNLIIYQLLKGSLKTSN
jgi:hypothetical protein